MAGIPDLFIIMGGLLSALGTAGAVGRLLYRIPGIRLRFDRFYGTLPMGRSEVQRLNPAKTKGKGTKAHV